MSTLTTIQGTDLITNSRANINDNFSALNSEKLETSVLDTDTTLAANSDAKVATQKAVKAYIDAQTLLNLEVETTAGATHTLTTTANQKVMVWAKGTLVESGTTQNMTLKYGGVTKDTVVWVDADTGGYKHPFSLMYTETPGAATANITVETDNGTLQDVVIMVLKI